MTPRWGVLSAAVVLVVAVSGVHGQGDLVLYDDFNAKVIDPDRWIGLDFGFGPTDRREQVREIASNSLRLASRLWSDPTAFGGSRNGGSAAIAANSATVRAVEAEFRVWEADAQSCVANPPATATARFHGFFFNTGEGVPPSPGVPPNNTGDVAAELAIFRNSNSPDPEGVLIVDERVFRCNNNGCSNVTTIGQVGPLGTVHVKEKVRVRVEWNEPASQFVFQLGDNAPLFIDYTPLLTGNPTKAAISPTKRIEAVNTVQNCAGLRSVAYTDLRADNVRVNP